jgi:hypothetical protein
MNSRRRMLQRADKVGSIVRHPRDDATSPSIAFRIGSEIVPQASTTLSKSASTAARSSHWERPECSAHAAQHTSQLTQSQTVSAVPSELLAGSSPAVPRNTLIRIVRWHDVQNLHSTYTKSRRKNLTSVTAHAIYKGSHRPRGRMTPRKSAAVNPSRLPLSTTQHNVLLVAA